MACGSGLPAKTALDINGDAEIEGLGAVVLWQMVFDGKTWESGTLPETPAGGTGGSKLGHPRPVVCPDIVSPFCGDCHGLIDQLVSRG